MYVPFFVEQDLQQVVFLRHGTANRHNSIINESNEEIIPTVTTMVCSTLN